MNGNRFMVLSLLALAACSADRPKDDANENEAEVAAIPDMPVEEYQKRQAAFADSVLNSVAPAREVALKLGKGYDVGSVRLRDTVAVLAGQKSQCFPMARKTDPYLAGTISVFVHMNVIGSDVVRVQESKWTSAAGNLVDACLNKEAQNWRFNSTFGKPAAYIVQVQFK